MCLLIDRCALDRAARRASVRSLKCVERGFPSRVTDRRGTPFRLWGEVLRSWQLRLLRCLRLLRSTSPLTGDARHVGSGWPPLSALPIVLREHEKDQQECGF
jgi:hypothetical protein